MRSLVTFILSIAGMILIGRPTWPQERGAGQNQRVRERDLLYVAVPGRGNDIAYGGIGVLAFDVKEGYRFVKRIPTWDYPASQEPENVKGIAASAVTGMLYVSTLKRLAGIDLMTDKIVWEQTFDGECCDRMAVSPDGKILYVPSYRGMAWYVVDAMNGKLIKKLPTPKTAGSHNTIWSLDGRRVFMSGEFSPNISVADPNTHAVVQMIGPFSNSVRPYTLNGKGTYLFANVDDLLGFEVADLKTGKMIHRVEVAGFGWSRDRFTSHVCPSHGIALSPDEKELWIADGVNGYLHIFDATVMPPKQMRSIKTRDFPYWITFGIDGKFIYPSSGDVIDASTKKIVAGLKDEFGRQVESEKLVEVLFTNGKPSRTVDQFGLGYKVDSN